MPLTDTEKRAMYELVIQEQGLSVKAKDRLDAFEEGVRAAIVAMSPVVSMDEDVRQPEETEG